MSYTDNLKQIFIQNNLINSDKDKQHLKCFLHHEKNGNSLYIDFSRNFFKCYGKCQQSGNIQKLLNLSGINYTIDNQYLISTFLNNQGKQTINEIKKEEISFKSWEEKYNKNIKDIYYLENRLLKREIYSKNLIYQSKYNDRIYMPIFNVIGLNLNKKITKDDIKIDGYISRLTTDVKNIHQKLIYEFKSYLETKYDLNNENIGKEIEFETLYDENSPLFIKYNKMINKYGYFERYKNSYSLDKNNILYSPMTNNFKYGHITVICEGILDCLMFNQLGYNALAILGSGLNFKQINQILNISEHYKQRLILAFDNDITGDKFYFKFINESKMFIERINWKLLSNNDRKIKDVYDVNRSEIKFLIENTFFM